MTTKKVNQYKCDYCGKKNYSAPHMVHHEERCTKNPHRVCGICKLLELEQPDINTLIAILPNPEELRKDTGDEFGVIIDDTKVREVFPKLRDAAENCPACIMAALRQKGIDVPMTRGYFDFTKECQDIFNELNTEKDDSYSYYG